MKTSYPKPADPQWFVVDASNATLGRLSARIATILRGKHKPSFVPHLPSGDHVIVINASQVKLTGTKKDDKVYYRHTGFFGHLRETPVRRMLDEKPEEIIRLAVKGMLPKNTMRDALLKRLHVYAAAEHKHEAQKPESLSLS